MNNASARSKTPPLPPLPPAEALWVAACQASTSFLLVIDEQGRILSANRAEKGRDLHDVVGRTILEFATPQSAPLVTTSIQRIFSTGQMQSLEIPARWLSGEQAYFSARGIPIVVGGNVVAALVCAEDMIALKTSEEALHKERQVLRRLLEIQERERQLISYEIHDGLTQYLAGAMMHLQSVEHAKPSAAAGRELHESLRLLRAAVDESRRLISGLRPPALDELGIVDAVDSLVSDARIDVPAVTFVHHLPAARLAPHLETAIFRIVQESLSNARRHANAATVDVRLEEVDRAGERRIRVTVHDDGIGFDPAAVPEDRFGLEGIRQRARLLGAEAVIASAAGQGTSIAVDLPCMLAPADAEETDRS